MIDLVVIRERLEKSLDIRGINHVYTALPVKSSPPPRSYFGHYDRLAVPVNGVHTMLASSEEKGGDVIEPVPGQATFMPARCWNRPYWKEPVEVLTFIFEDSWPVLSYVNNRIDSDERILLRFPLAQLSFGAGQLLFLLKNGVGEAAMLKKSPFLIRALLVDLLNLMKKDAGRRGGTALAGCREISSFIDEYYWDDCSRDRICETFFLTPNYLSNLFRKHSGCSFTEYVNQVRVRHSLAILRETNATVEEIAASCGFGSAAYFCRVFRKVTGKRPGEMRKRSTVDAP